MSKLSYENKINLYNDMNNDYFYDYNTLNPTNKILAPRGISYCMFVKMG